jgi:hypothetical protein
MYKFRYTIKTSLEQIKLVQDFLRARDCNFTHKRYKEYCYNELIYTIDTDTFIHRCTRLDIHSFKHIGETIVETEYTLEEIPLYLFPGIEKYNLIRSVEMSSTKFGNELVQLKSIVEDGDPNVPCYYNVIVKSYDEMPEVLKSIMKYLV